MRICSATIFGGTASSVTIYGIMQYLQTIYCSFGEFYVGKCGNIVLLRSISFLPYTGVDIRRGYTMKLNTLLSSEYDATISLLNIYFAEWHYRSQVLWSQTFKFYYAILIIILLPNLATYIQVDLPRIPILAFRVVGLLLSFVYLYISLGYAIRLQAAGITYQSIIDKLPPEYERKRIKDIKYKNVHIGKMFTPNFGYIICFALFLSLLVLAVTLMII